MKNAILFLLLIVPFACHPARAAEQIRFKDITTTSTAPASDDYIPMDGATNGTRKILGNKFALAATNTGDQQVFGSIVIGANTTVPGSTNGTLTFATGAGISITPSGTGNRMLTFDTVPQDLGPLTQGGIVLENGGLGKIQATGNGTLLIGNSLTGNFHQGTLTAGNDITITNGTASIGIAANIALGNATGNLAVARLNGGTGASSSSYWRGDGTWATPGGSGNVTNNGTLTADYIIAGSGTTVVKPTGVSITSNNIVTSGNVTAASLNGNLTSTSATVTTLTATAISGATVDGQLFVGNATTGNFTKQTPSGDATLAASGVVTLATVNSNTGTFGSATAAPAVTVNGKGQITAASNVTITPAVGSITGLGTGVSTALAANANASGGVVTGNGTATLTNKRVEARITTITSSATPTINTDNCDAVTITALAAAITSMSTNLTGTPANFDQLLFRIKDDGTARAITWGASFAARGAALPTTTTLGKVTYALFIWNSVASTWDCVSTATET